MLGMKCRTQEASLAEAQSKNRQRNRPSKAVHICRAQSRPSRNEKSTCRWPTGGEAVGNQLQLQAAAPYGHCQQAHKEIEVELLCCQSGGKQLWRFKAQRLCLMGHTCRRLQIARLAMMGHERIWGSAWSAHSVQQKSQACGPESIAFMLWLDKGLWKTCCYRVKHLVSPGRATWSCMTPLGLSYACWLVCEAPLARHLLLSCSGWQSSIIAGLVPQVELQQSCWW